MSERNGIGVVGLGVMGQRMLARVAEHPPLRALIGGFFDAPPQVEHDRPVTAQRV